MLASCCIFAAGCDGCLANRIALWICRNAKSATKYLATSGDWSRNDVAGRGSAVINSVVGTTSADNLFFMGIALSIS